MSRPGIFSTLGMLSFDLILSKQFILSKLSEEEIFQRYLQVYPRLGDKYINTLPGRPKADRRPGCNFFERSDGRLIFKDWAWKNFDCIEAAQQYYGVGYHKTLQFIARDFNLLSDELVSTNREPVSIQQQEPRRKHREGYTPIQVKRKPWKSREVTFWQLPDRPVAVEELEQLYTFSISHFWMDGKLAGQDLSMSFGYYLGNPDKWQIYRPLVKNSLYKFRQSSSAWLIGTEGLSQVGYVLVTKSYKDYVILKLLGFNVCCVLSETMWFDEAQQQLLDSYGSVFLLYDNDEPGIKAATERADFYDWRFLTYPTAVGKDSYACARAKGGNWVTDYLLELLESI